MQRKEGIVYVALGEPFIREAENSARTVRQWMPGLPICLVTNEPYAGTAFDEVILGTEHTLHPYHFKFNMALAPFERVLFLDSDTELRGDVSDLFRCLDDFEIALHKDYYAYEVAPYEPEVGYSLLPEYNCGVIAFRNSAPVRDMLSAAAEEYVRLHQATGFIRMQRAFIKVLLKSQLRIADLPIDYNFMPYNCALLTGPVRILHGRIQPHFARFLVEDDLAGSEPRVFIPQLGTIRNFSRRMYGVPRQKFLWSIIWKALRASVHWWWVEDLPRYPDYFISGVRVHGGAVKARLLTLLGLRRNSTTFEDKP